MDEVVWWYYITKINYNLYAGKVVQWNLKCENVQRACPHTHGTLGASYGAMKDSSTSQAGFHGSLSHKVPQSNAFSLRSLSKVT